MISSLRQCFEYILNAVAQHTQRWVKPDNPSLFADTALDLSRSKAELILENAFLRQQFIVLNRQVIRPAIKPRERVCLVVLASGLWSWFISADLENLPWTIRQDRHPQPCQRDMGLRHTADP